MHRHVLITGQFENVARVAMPANFPAHLTQPVACRNNGQVAQ